MFNIKNLPRRKNFRLSSIKTVRKHYQLRHADMSCICWILFIFFSFPKFQLFAQKCCLRWFVLMFFELSELLFWKYFRGNNSSQDQRHFIIHRIYSNARCSAKTLSFLVKNVKRKQSQSNICLILNFFCNRYVVSYIKAVVKKLKQNGALRKRGERKECSHFPKKKNPGFLTQQYCIQYIKQFTDGCKFCWDLPVPLSPVRCTLDIAEWEPGVPFGFTDFYINFPDHQNTFNFKYWGNAAAWWAKGIKKQIKFWQIRHPSAWGNNDVRY